MSKKTTRRSQIIATLSELSKHGWANALPEDYEPLEKELRQLDKGRAS